jgi:hypothetical protein
MGIRTLLLSAERGLLGTIKARVRVDAVWILLIVVAWLILSRFTGG